MPDFSRQTFVTEQLARRTRDALRPLICSGIRSESFGHEFNVKLDRHCHQKNLLDVFLVCVTPAKFYTDSIFPSDPVNVSFAS